VRVPVLLALWAANGLAAPSQTPQNPRQENGNQISTPGRQTFASRCASCHGLDGRGGERAPNIAENPKVRSLSDVQILHIIENGIPGAGMPAFHSLASSDRKAVVTYLRTLAGTKRTVTKRTVSLPGNPDRGESIFFGKAACSSCHMVAGKGGFIASDLSVYAGTHALEQIRDAITTPAPGNDRQARMVTATTRGGGKVVGRIRNEDNFSLQLQTLDGTFYFVAKSDLEGLESNSQALMPSDYGSTLSPNELNDVVSYLMAVSNSGASEPKTLAKDSDEQ
jgi:putative heme-binding domain-containing protein